METMTGQPENLSNETEAMATPSNEEELGQQNKDLHEALAEAHLSESRTPEKIAAVSEEIKESKSPEEIKMEIKRLQAEYEMKNKAWQSFTTISSADTDLGSFGGSAESVAELENKFPGIGKVLEMIKLAEKKGDNGFKLFNLKTWKNFNKEPELGDVEIKAIKNYLIHGGMGEFTDPNAEAVARKALDKFLSENSQAEGDVANIKQAIWGEHDDRYYERAITDLNQQLEQMNEAK